MDEKNMQELLQRLTRIEVKLEEIIDVKKDVEHLKAEVIKMTTTDSQQQKEIDELRDGNKWLTRAVIGGIIAGVIGLGFAVIKYFMGV